MVRLSLIARVRDGLPLAEGLDADKEHEMYSYKSQAKVGAGAGGLAVQLPPAGGLQAAAAAAAGPGPRGPWAALTGTPRPRPPPRPRQGIFKKMAGSSSRPPPRMSIESGAFTFHYLIEGDVCYLTLVEKAYPKKLAFQYLEELQSEFSRLYGEQIEGVTRPYAFIKFGARGGCCGAVRGRQRSGGRQQRLGGRERWLLALAGCTSMQWLQPPHPLLSTAAEPGHSSHGWQLVSMQGRLASHPGRSALPPPPLPPTCHRPPQTPSSRRPRSCTWTPARSATWPN